MSSKPLANIKTEQDEDMQPDEEDEIHDEMNCLQAVNHNDSSTEDASICEQYETDRKDDQGKKLISPYNKRRILQLLMTRGCSALCFERSVANFHIDSDHLKEYMNTQIQRAIEHVGEECESLCFQNITNWLLLIEEIGLNEFCDYEAALIMKAIAGNEEQPNPETMGGIDMKEIYNFLGNALMGLPQVGLNAESAKFLADEFESLINDVNETEAESETIQMKDILFSEAKCDNDVSKLRAKLSLDPLELDPALTNLL